MQSEDNTWSHLNNFLFGDILRQVILHRNDKRKQIRSSKPKEQNHSHPSGMGDCLRLRWFGHADQRESPDDDLLKIFFHGDLIHDDLVYPVLKYWLTHIVGIKNFTITNEFPFRFSIDHGGKEIIFSGYVDNVIQRFNQGETEVIPIEVKSFGGNLKYLTEPYLSAKVQIMSYLGFLKAPMGKVIYVQKATLEAKTFDIHFDQETFDGLMDRECEFQDYKDSGTIPPAEAMNEFDKGNSWYTMLTIAPDGKKQKHPCGRCEFWDFCKKNPHSILPEDDDDEW